MSTATKEQVVAPANTILVLHDDHLDPRPFLHRLSQTPDRPPIGTGPHDENEDIRVPWTIENKYYTAHVSFAAWPLDQLTLEGMGVEVVMYLFEEDPPNPLPPVLVQLITAEPRDIALAIRIRSSPLLPANGSSGKEPQVHTRNGRSMGWEEVEELFDELGMEVIEEEGEAEEDDERPISPLEGIRQTLMTHMWPNMIRKALGLGVPLALDLDEEVDDVASPDRSGHDDEPGTDGVGFPITFSTAAPGILSKAPAPGEEDQGSFPSMEELLSQLSHPPIAGPSRHPLMDMDLGDNGGGQLGRRNGLERLEMLELDDELFGDLSRGEGPGEEEYARLDDWLDDDGEDHDHDDGGGGGGDYEEEGDRDGFVVLSADEGQEGHLPDRPAPSSEHEKHNNALQGEEEGGFEDDFADFQSAAPVADVPRGRGGAQLPLDPTPLLLHLQSVRAELMGVEDPDERRKRAGREVEMIMRGLGMEAGLGLDYLEDLEHLG